MTKRIHPCNQRNKAHFPNAHEITPYMNMMFSGHFSKVKLPIIEHILIIEHFPIFS
jgi:hypothetical protein